MMAHSLRLQSRLVAVYLHQRFLSRSKVLMAFRCFVVASQCSESEDSLWCSNFFCSGPWRMNDLHCCKYERVAKFILDAHFNCPGTGTWIWVLLQLFSDSQSDSSDTKRYGYKLFARKLFSVPCTKLICLSIIFGMHYISPQFFLYSDALTSKTTPLQEPLPWFRNESSIFIKLTSNSLESLVKMFRFLWSVPQALSQWNNEPKWHRETQGWYLNKFLYLFAPLLKMEVLYSHFSYFSQVA